MRKLHSYMVVYNHSTGIGRIEIKRKTKIKSYGDIEGLDKSIREYHKEVGGTVKDECVTGFYYLGRVR